MVLRLAQYVPGQQLGIGNQRKHRPMLNESKSAVTDTAIGWNISTVLKQKQQFWRWFKGRPELNSPVLIRTDDTIGEVEFFGKNGEAIGRNKRIEAEKFWNNNYMYERLKSMQMDRLTTGSGFLWKGKHSAETVDRYVKKALKEFSFKGINIKESDIKEYIDEDLRRVRIIDYIPSSTMLIEHDRYDIQRYTQWVLAETQHFTPEEILHIPLLRADGKVDGWTPVASLSYELVLIWAIKENMMSYIRNGGSMAKIFVLPEENANSINHQWLKQELSNVGALQNRHGNMILTGKVDMIEVENKIKDLEYKELALYATSNIAYALRVPVGRIPYLIGKAQSDGDAGGLAESGYWSMIESDQRTLEMHINPLFAKEFGFTIKFKKQYKLNDLRDAQALTYRIDAVSKMQDELAKKQLCLTESKMLELLNVSTNEIEKMKDLPIMGTNKLNPQMPEKEYMRNEGQQMNDDVKRTASINNPKNANQTGY